MNGIKRLLIGISLLVITTCCNQFAGVPSSEVTWGLAYYGGRLTFVLGLIFVITGIRTKNERN